MNRIAFILILILMLSLPLWPAAPFIIECVLYLALGAFTVLAIIEGIRSN